MKRKTEEDTNYFKKVKANKDVNKFSSEEINGLNGKAYSDNYYKIYEIRKKLPAFHYKSVFLNKILENQVIVVVGETGSGKTTQCPQFFIDYLLEKNKKLIITQPRRVAAITIASRVAEELDVKLGEEVGYAVRFEAKFSSNTLIKFVTDGYLLRELQSDVELSAYGIIIIDEAHERTADTDILLGVLKNILGRRPDLRLIIMSASLNSKLFIKFFNASLIKIEGRTYPVEIVYTSKSLSNYQEYLINKIISIHINEPEGDILVFLTGEEEIEKVKNQLLGRTDQIDKFKYGIAEILPLYSSLPLHLQKLVFKEAPKPISSGGKKGRKIILSTNLAETSITIDGIVYVIDCGFHKQNIYNPRNRIENLVTLPIPKSSALQRAGRAGRTKPGICYRLYTEETFNSLKENFFVEILRINVSKVILCLLKIGFKNIIKFPFIEAPAPETFMQALEELNFLGCINENGELTEFGNNICEIPLDPLFAALLLKGLELKVGEKSIILVSVLSSQNLFINSKNAKSSSLINIANKKSDHISLINIFLSYTKSNSKSEWCREYGINERSISNAYNVYNQLKSNNIVKKLIEYSSLNEKDECRKILEAVVFAFYQKIAVYSNHKNDYIAIQSQTNCKIHPSSFINGLPKLLVYNNIVTTTKTYIRVVSEIEMSTLKKMAPNYYNYILNKKFCKEIARIL